MTVNSDNSKAGPYDGNGATTDFPFNFRILDESHIRVIITDDAGEETDADPSTYTVSGVGDSDGSVAYPNVGSALPSGYKLTILRNVPLTQDTDIANAGGFYPEEHEKVFDKLTMMVQQVSEEVSRSVKVQASDTETDPDQLIATLTVAANTAVAAAEDAAAAAELAEDFADNSAASAAAAEASATAAANIIQSAMFRDVVFLTSADSPFSVTQAHNGKMLAVDTSGGAVIINLAQINTLALPFTLGVKKMSADGNAITVSRTGTDTIDGATTKIISSASAGATFIPDTDPAPDRWTTAEFGPAAGNMIPDVFTGDGVRTSDTLSVDPGSKNNTWVIIGGVPQFKSDYSISGNTITYSSPPANGVKIEVLSGTTLSIGVPADGTVSTNKIVDDAVTTNKILNAAVTFAKMAAAALATTAEIISGTASKLVTAAGLAPLYYGTKAIAPAQAVTTFQKVTLTSEEYDDGGWHDNATNNSRITVDFTGRVVVTANAQGSVNAPATYAGYIYKNNVQQVADQSYIGSASGVGVSMSQEFACVPGDYFEMGASCAGATFSLSTLSTLSVRRIK